MKIRVLVMGLLALLGLAGCAHQPVSQGASADDVLGGTIGYEPYSHATTGLEPYQQVLSDPGPF